MQNILWLGAFGAAIGTYLIVSNTWPLKDHKSGKKTGNAHKPAPNTGRRKNGFGKR